MLSPVFPTCAVRRHQSKFIREFTEYTAIWNLLGFPCGVIPVAKVLSHEQFFKDHFGDRLTLELGKSAFDSEGMPISLQMVGHAHDDEKVLAILKLLEQKLKVTVKPPRLSEESIGHFIRRETMPTNYGSVNVELFSSQNFGKNQLKGSMEEDKRELLQFSTRHQSDANLY